MVFGSIQYKRKSVIATIMSVLALGYALQQIFNNWSSLLTEC